MESKTPHGTWGRNHILSWAVQLGCRFQHTNIPMQMSLCYFSTSRRRRGSRADQGIRRGTHAEPRTRSKSGLNYDKNELPWSRSFKSGRIYFTDPKLRTTWGTQYTSQHFAWRVITLWTSEKSELVFVWTLKKSGGDLIGLHVKLILRLFSSLDHTAVFQGDLHDFCQFTSITGADLKKK